MCFILMIYVVSSFKRTRCVFSNDVCGLIRLDGDYGVPQASWHPFLVLGVVFMKWAYQGKHNFHFRALGEVGLILATILVMFVKHMLDEQFVPIETSYIPH